ncbi:MAG: substrate-binding domain-containing protein [Chloroflexota bacterium]
MLRKSRLITIVLTLGLVLTLSITAGMKIAAQDSSGTTDKWCSDVNIVFFPGGPAGGAFAINVYNGALQAAADLGANVQYSWSNWDPQTMVTQLGEAIATKPDGIAIMGHPGDDAYQSAVDDAESQGIIVTSQNTDLPKLEAAYQSNGFGYVGAKQYDAGWSLATEAIKRSGVVSGDRAVLWGLLAQAGRGERTRGAKEALEKAGLTVDYYEIDQATNADPTAGIATVSAYITSHPDVKLLITDHGAMTSTMESYLTAAGVGPDDIYAAGFDMSPSDITAIKDGYLDLVIDQQEWLQGYLPILQICLTKKYAFTGLDINTGAGFATKDNIDVLADLITRVIR